MKINEIKYLLDLFYDGSTTIEQENLLKHYFLSNDVAGELLHERDVFLSFYESDIVDVPVVLSDAIEGWMDEKIELEKKKELKVLRKLKLDSSFILSIVAAVLIALFIIPFAYNDVPKENNSRLSDTDIVALNEANDALKLMSTKWNKGVKQLDEVPQTIKKTNIIVKRVLTKKENHE